jgi:tetratricopeptide (TPR) repeat protein
MDDGKKDLDMFKHRVRQIGLLLVVVPVSITLLLTSGCSRDPNVRKHKYLESGKRYEKDGKYKEASIQFQNALKVDKNFADAHYEMSKTYFKLGQVQPGYMELLHTVDLAPGNVQARLDLGGILLAGNALDRAQEQAKAVLLIDAKNAEAYALLSGIAARRGDVPLALKNIQDALAIKPNEASFHTALALLDNSDPEKGGAAEQELQKAISLDPKDARAQIVYAAVLERKGDTKGAEQHYLAAIQADPKELRARSSLAGLYLRAGDTAKTEQTLRKAVEDIPDSQAAADLLKDYYYRTGHPDVAEAVYADLTTKYPKSYPIKITYAGILASKGEFAKVQPIADQLEKSDGGKPQVVVLKSALLLNAGKANEAFALLQSAAKTTPDDVKLQIALGKVAQSKQDFGTAEASFRAAEKIDPQNLEAQQGLAQVSLERGDAATLEQTAAKMIASHPDFAEAYLWKGIAEAGTKQYDKAETDLQTALTKNPNNPAVYTQLGMLRLRQAKQADAIAMFEKALEKDANSTTALYSIVTVYMQQKQPAKAIARVQQQIAKSPKNPSFYTLLADIQINTDDAAGARDSAKKVMELNPADGRAVQIYTQAEVNLGDRDEAIRAWEKWLAAHPKDNSTANASSMVGMLYDSKGDTAKAMDYYKKALDIDPNQGRAANNLAYLMVTSGQNADVALSYAQTARRAMPNNPSTADTLALVYYYKGTYFSAKELLEAAMKQDSTNAAMHYHLGMTYNKLGRRQDAVVELKKAIALAGASKDQKDVVIGKDAAALLALMT